MSYKEPVVIFVPSAKKGRELATEKGWPFIGGGSTNEMVSIAVDGFRKGAEPGIVLGYHWAGAGLNLRRPNTHLILVNCPNQAREAQAISHVRPVSITRLASISELEHKCHCGIQTLNLRGCQCGGA